MEKMDASSNSESPIVVRSLHVVSEVECRFCTTEVVSRMANTDTKMAHEAQFNVELPDTAFISHFDMYCK